MHYTMDQFLTELCDCFENQQESALVLKTIQFPSGLLPNAAGTILVFWTDILRRVRHGAIPSPDGLRTLAHAALSLFPSNLVFEFVARGGELLEHGRSQAATQELPHRPTPPQPARAAAPREVPVASPPSPGATGPFRVLELTGHSDTAAIFEVLSGLDPQLQLLWGQRDGLAVLLTDRTVTEQDARRAVSSALGVQVQGAIRDYPYRPYMFQNIEVSGPDNQTFYLASVPNTTRVSAVPPAIMQEYSGATSIRGRRMRTVVDLVLPGGGTQRLDPNRTLHEAGVTEGSRLRVSAEQTAGRGDLDYQEHALRAKNEIFEFADDHHDVITLTSFAPNDLPAEYAITLHVPGIGWGEAGAYRIDEHQIKLLLPPGTYPVYAPIVSWETEVFHPNIGVKRIERINVTVRRLCLGQLDKYYTKALDFGDLMRTILDVAQYRQYSLPDRHDPEGTGAFNLIAAEWAATIEGQQMIEAIGGVSGLERLPDYYPGEEEPSRLKVRRRPAR
jgi:ubiquitin-protein ligase